MENLENIIHNVSKKHGKLDIISMGITVGVIALGSYLLIQEGKINSIRDYDWKSDVKLVEKVPYHAFSH